MRPNYKYTIGNIHTYIHISIYRDIVTPVCLLDFTLNLLLLLVIICNAELADLLTLQSAWQPYAGSTAKNFHRIVLSLNANYKLFLWQTLSSLDMHMHIHTSVFNIRAYEKFILLKQRLKKANGTAQSRAEWSGCGGEQGATRCLLITLCQLFVSQCCWLFLCRLLAE